jgi:hypothetical protein
MAKKRTDKRISVYLPADLHAQLSELPKINRSRVCRIALEHAVAEHLGHERARSVDDAMTELPLMERDLRNLRSTLGRLARDAAEHAGLVVMTKEEAQKLNQQEACEAAVTAALAEEGVGAIDPDPEKEAIQGGVASSEAEVVEEVIKTLGKPHTCGRCEHLFFETMECRSPFSRHRGEERGPDDKACDQFDKKCIRCGHLASVHGKRLEKGLEAFRFCDGDQGPCADKDGHCECSYSRCEILGTCICGSEHCTIFTNEVIRRAEAAEAVEAETRDADEVREELPGATPVYGAAFVPEVDPSTFEIAPGEHDMPVVMSGPQDPMHDKPLMEEATPGEVTSSTFPPETEFLPDDAELEWLLPGIMFEEIWNTGGLKKRLRPREFQAPIADRPLKRAGTMTLRELPMDGGPATGRKIVVDILKTHSAKPYQNTAQVRFTFKVLECQEPPRCVGTECDVGADTECSQCGAPLCWSCWAGDSGVDEEPTALCPACHEALNNPDQPASAS